MHSTNTFMKKYFLILLIILLVQIGCTTNQTELNEEIDSKYLSNDKYCVIDSDCVVQETQTSLCCGNACPISLNKYNFVEMDRSEICADRGCTDRFYTCPNFEVKCVENVCTIILEE